MKPRRRYYPYPISPFSTKWHVLDADNYDLPIYDDEPDGRDKPIVYDRDDAYQVADNLNENPPTTPTS